MAKLRSLVSFLLPHVVLAVDPLVELNYTSYNGFTNGNGITQWLGIRYAAPPVADLRFAAPQDPPATSTTQDASQHGLYCIGTGDDVSEIGDTQSEDCLFLDIYAPTNASTDSSLPVFFFIQGGGFNSNSSPNLNGTGLVNASGKNIIVVTLNYRVGPWGFLASEEVAAGGSLNNGLKDQIKALEWVQKYISKFGGDPDHVVIGGNSAGGASVTLLLTAYGGTLSLFAGGAAQSQSFATQWTVSESQFMYDNLAIRTGCANATDTLDCLRSISATDLQSVNFDTPFPGAMNPPLFMYGPTIDEDLVPDYTYALFAQGRFANVPTIFGSDANDGTRFVPMATSTLADTNEFLRDQFPALTLSQLREIDELYPDTGERFPNAGAYWRQGSNAYQDVRYTCPGLFLSQQMTERGLDSYLYRWNVQDPAQVSSGLGVPHSSEMAALFAPEYDQPQSGAPASYSTTNRFIIPVMQGYWTSFVRSLDPNQYRYEDTPVWEAWDDSDPERIMLQTNATAMESVSGSGVGHLDRCEYLWSIGAAIRQ